MKQTLKNDQNKTDLSMIDNQFVHGISKILMFGAEKYERDNWRLGTQWSRTFSACKRHLDAWWDGENNDPETGLSHLYHAACNLMFLDYWQRYERGEDNRYKVKPEYCPTSVGFNDESIKKCSWENDCIDCTMSLLNKTPYYKPKVSPECAGQDCDLCDSIREGIADVKAGRTYTHEQVWSGDCPLETLSCLVKDEIKRRDVFELIDYKGKATIIQDHAFDCDFPELDIVVGTISREDAIKQAEHRIAVSDLYGIPAYIGDDMELNELYGNDHDNYSKD